MKSIVSKVILVVGLLLSIWLLTGSIIAAAIILAVIGPVSVATFQEARRVAEELQVVDVPEASTSTLNERLQASLAKHPDSGVSLMPLGVRAFLRENELSGHVVMIRDGDASVVPTSEALAILDGMNEIVVRRGPREWKLQRAAAREVVARSNGNWT